MINENSLEKFSLKYESGVPKDYDISEMEFTFDFIYLVFKRDSDIDRAIKGVANEYNLSENSLFHYLTENKYILDKNNRNEFSKQLKGYNTKSLKRILKKHGLKTSGKRSQIEQRIYENNILRTNYHLSSKSKIFYKNKKRRINIYNEYLYKHYYFNEFNEFYMDNFRKKEAKIPIEFIKMHIKKSILDKNHENYISNNQIMVEHLFLKKNYKLMLEHVLKCFCMNLNPIWKISNFNGHVGVTLDTYEDLMFLNEEIGKNRIISAYYAVWDSFNFEKIVVPKFEGYRILKDILNLKDYERINRNLDKKFYSNRDLKIKRITQKTLFDF